MQQRVFQQAMHKQGIPMITWSFQVFSASVWILTGGFRLFQLNLTLMNYEFLIQKFLYKGDAEPQGNWEMSGLAPTN